MNEEYIETVRHILQSNRSSFEHLAKQCQSHIERIDNALKKLEKLQEPKKPTWVDELPDKEKFIKFLKESAHYMWTVEVNSDETHQLILSVLESLGVKDNEDVQD